MPLPSKNNYEILLYPFSLLYGLAVWIRNTLFDYQVIPSHEFPIPVISVGNITVGGTGKTPHVEYLATLLKKEFSVAVLSRGYKRKTRHFILADENSTVRDIGDEPFQIKRKFPDIHVAVDRKRVNGIQELMNRIPDLDVILLDDAYQHRHVKPGLSILLINFNRPLENDHLLPAGRLREQSYEKRRANIILITKCPDRLKPIERRIIVKDLKLYPFQNLYFTKLAYAEPRYVFDREQKAPTHNEIRGQKPLILMVTGIAGPRLFKKHLRGISTHITEMIFRDHHEFKERDFSAILQAFDNIEAENKIICTTEKDAVRLRKFENMADSIRDKIFYIPVRIEIINEDTEEFNAHINNYVRNNKRNSILYKKQD